MNYLLLFFTLITTVGGQIILKFGQRTLYLPKGLNKFEIINFIQHSLLNKYTIFAILFTALGVISWLIVIQRMKLSVAYPFMSLSYVIVFLFSYFVFKETISIYQILGIILIFLGVFFITLK